MNVFTLFTALKNPRFARLYSAQAISQIGDALTWVGLALLAYQLARANAAVVLGTALPLRVLAFVIFSPLAGVVTGRINRKWLLITCDFGRVLVSACLPFVHTVWQVYVLMFVLNTFTAFFAPTNQATIPLVMGQDDAGQGFALSSATTELINIAGLGLAGVAAALLSGRNLFFLDAVTVLLSGLLILTLPSLQAQQGEVQRSTLSDIRDGTSRLWRDPPIRFALLMELVAAIAGALILVGTVTHVKTDLHLGDPAGPAF